MSITIDKPAPTKEYSIVIEHLELDFWTDDNETPSSTERQRITDEQTALPLVVSVDASATKEDIVDVICDAISERSGWCVEAVNIDWFGSGVDAVDLTDLTYEQKGELYEMLSFYTRKCFDSFMLLHNEAIDDFISKRLGLEDEANRLFDLIDEQVRFDFILQDFDADRWNKEQIASNMERLRNL